MYSWWMRHLSTVLAKAIHTPLVACLIRVLSQLMTLNQKLKSKTDELLQLKTCQFTTPIKTQQLTPKSVNTAFSSAIPPLRPAPFFAKVSASSRFFGHSLVWVITMYKFGKVSSRQPARMKIFPSWLLKLPQDLKDILKRFLSGPRLTPKISTTYKWVVHQKKKLVFLLYTGDEIPPS